MATKTVLERKIEGLVTIMADVLGKMGDIQRAMGQLSQKVEQTEREKERWSGMYHELALTLLSPNRTVYGGVRQAHSHTDDRIPSAPSVQTKPFDPFEELPENHPEGFTPEELSLTDEYGENNA